MKEADEKIRNLVSAKNDGENLCYAVEKQLQELKEKISSGDKTELDDKMSKLRAEMTNDDGDIERVQSLTKELQDVSWHVTQASYPQGGAEEQSQSSDESNPR